MPSNVAGFIAPNVSPAPLEGQAFDGFLQQIIVGITGMTGSLVRPRWQPEPPNLPAIGTTWAAFGVMLTTPDTYAAIIHRGAGEGTDELQRHETNEVLISFYGPDADLYASRLRDGLQIAQNREMLFLNGMAHVETKAPISVPTLVKERWLYRLDVTWVMRRAIQRVYPILNVLSAQGSINYEDATVDFVVNP